MVKSHTCVRSALVLSVLAGTAALTACDQRTDATKSVQAAAQSLHAVGVAPGIDTAKYEGKLKQIGSSLSDVAANGTAGEKASAAIIIAETTKGQGEIQALAAKNTELTLRNKITQLHALIGDWSRHSSGAAALETFDPAADIAAFKASKTAREAELKDHEAQLAVAQASQAKFAAESKAKAAQADIAAQQYAALSQSTVKMSATDAAVVVKTANEHRRTADDLRTAAGKLEAQADLLTPIINEHKLLADKARNQIKNFDIAVKEFEARVAASRSEAKQSMDVATLAANDIDKLVIEIAEGRTKELDPAYGAAIDQFTKAASKSNAASDAAPGMAKVMAGSAKLSIGEAHWAKAQGARAFAATLESLASVKPALPNAADYAKKAQEAGEQAKTAIEAAGQALDEAKAAFESARISDKAVKERLTKLGEQVGKAKEVAAGAAMAPVAQPATAAASGDGQPAAAANVDPALLAFADQVLEATRAGRSASLIDAAVGLDDGAKAILKQAATMQDSLRGVDKACRDKFQKSVADVLATNPMMAQMMKAQGLDASSDSLRAANLSFDVQGDSATATASGMPQPLVFAKKDGAWALDLSAQGAMAPMLQAQAPMIAKVGEIMRGWGDDIAAGKFADPAAASAGLMQALAAVMGPMMGGPGGGG